jgi:protein involved in polysaccharide export with SLBB domain
MLIFLICGGFSVFAQEGGRNAARQDSVIDVNQNIMLARSSADYRVTPGDVYTLAYAVGSNPVSYTIAVDSSYRIRVSNLGIVNGAGKTFMQLKSEVEAVVANNYPLSGVQLVLTQPAVFKVHVKGEVPVAGEVPAWGLSRLSSLIGKAEISKNTDEKEKDTEKSKNIEAFSDALTPFASLRDVSIRSSNGQTRVYDLYKAQRLGDLSQDPYLRPGDEITFNRIKRLVTIDGEVERPGTYQLLDGENINELIAFYGSGFTPVADKTRLEMVRLINSADIAGDKIFLTENDIASNYVLENYDVITVPLVTQLQPVMFVEGAVVDIKNSTISTASELVSSNRLMVQFNTGETYASLVRKNIKWFTAVSDTQNAYILRNNEQIPINLNSMLYDASYRGEVFVQENDILVIPFRQYFVTVAGAVINPGRYPYIPDRDWEYYIALAGGFIMERNTFEAITITDLSGKRLKKTDAITPETVITAKTNHGLYYFNQFAPVITTVLTIVSTFLTVYIASGGVLK